jgi:hypothetical protein
MAKPFSKSLGRSLAKAFASPSCEVLLERNLQLTTTTRNHNRKKKHDSSEFSPSKEITETSQEEFSDSDS